VRIEFVDNHARVYRVDNQENEVDESDDDDGFITSFYGSD